jgi:hypothetical protein
MLALFFNRNRSPIATLERTFGRISMALGRPVPQGTRSARVRAALRELEGSVLAIQNRIISFANPGIQDFLQRVVIEDKLMPSIIGVVEEFAEFKQTWEIWSALSLTADAENSMAAAWGEAASRLLDTEEGSPLQRLALLIDIYDRLKTDELATLVNRAIDDLGQVTIDGDEADEARYLLERTISTLLPMDLLVKAQQVVTATVATMLQEYGWSLSLDTIKSVAKTLCDYGSDKKFAAKASATALKDYIEQLESALSEMTSVDELETFDRELNAAMKDYGVTNAMVGYYIDRRRDELFERGSEGHPKMGGRKKGTPNRIGGDLRAAVVAGIQAVGFMQKDKRGRVRRGVGGVQGFIEWLALHEPKTAAVLFSKVLPYFINVGMETPEVVSETEMEAMLKELGLPAGLIEHMQTAPAPLDLDEDPDPYGMHAEAAAKDAEAAKDVPHDR